MAEAAPVMGCHIFDLAQFLRRMPFLMQPSPILFGTGTESALACATLVAGVLEEVCKKQGFNPDDHGLKFQRNVLDLTLQWRFANLPNNAKLEVVPSTRQRGGADSTVRIALQLEEGSRLQGSFSSGQSLWDLLGHFPETRISELDVPGATPVCVYMRDEVSGEEALKRTTLRSLGLTGGSAILRYVLKASNTPGNNEPMETATTPNDTAAPASQPPPAVNTMHSDLPDEPIPAPVPMENTSPPSQTPEAADQTCQTLPVQQEQAEPSQDQHQVVRPKIRQANIQMPQEASSMQQMDEEQAGPSHKYHSHSTTPSNFVPFSGGGQRLGGSGGDEQRECPSPASSSSSPLSSGPPKAKKAKPSHEVQRSSSATCRAKDSEDAEEYLEPVDREPLVFHLDTAAQRQRDDRELPDEFFEVTVDDVRKRFSQLKSERRALEEAPLMTQSLREAQKKEKMDRYPKVVLRIQFPDRLVLQGFFRPLETVAVLKQFVRTHLQDPELPFYLFIAPPKTKLDDPSATLFQANLFPAALVYFGSDVKTECYLRRDLVDGIVSALQADELIAGCMPRSPAPSSSSLPPEDSLSLHTDSNGAPRSQENPEDPSDEQSQAPKPVRTDPAKVPKWLKLPGKK
ncbi:tether containing UBX domain for GLUT4 isoform X2 [Pangasianodon hypophthalmus]|uniref:tether containing UBX domain for GLUT4 isoform X2 n=1 Tax=Pangasianodon hypophthalmus TaxID=310915 RepID=UPI00230702B4|nr:tether containing UBX domain for GLUT4 isoform X2 [Pangasianodon hypophthalmus]